ncbi:hypothetical protein OAG24_00165 [bacterium]|nr:hypothetical protein [bacterium]
MKDTPIDFSRYKIYDLTKVKIIDEIEKCGHTLSRATTFFDDAPVIQCSHPDCDRTLSPHINIYSNSSKMKVCGYLYKINKDHPLFVLKEIIPTGTAWKSTIKELKNIAKENKVAITGLKTKLDIYKKIREALPEDDRFKEVYTDSRSDLGKMVNSKRQNTNLNLKSLREQFKIVFPNSSILKTLFTKDPEKPYGRDDRFDDWYFYSPYKQSCLKLLLVMLDDEAEYYKNLTIYKEMKLAEEAYEEDEKDRKNYIEN